MKQINKNGLNIILKNETMTPRMCITFFFKVDKKEKFAGINSLLARLLLQGTKKYAAEQLALAFENACIDTSVKAKQDYIKISSIFLNEDFNLAIELLQDIIKNSTFDDFEKEVHKIKGDIVADLDTPKTKLLDAFGRRLFKNHAYEDSNCTKILEDIDKITKQDILKAHEELLNSKKVLTIVGYIKNEDEIVNALDEKFNFLNNDNSKDEIETKYINNIEKDEYIWLSKNDASQAQIIQGWLTDSYNDNIKSAKISVFNNILGSSGLSSRLFVNLRDKQGLAYTVRSQYEMLLRSAVVNMYIGTAPNNIEKSLKGFEDELQKLASTPPDLEELNGAKENIKGRIKYFKQNNAQIASITGYDSIMGLSLNYDEEFQANIDKVTKEDVSKIALEFLEKPKLIAILAPDKYKIDF